MRLISLKWKALWGLSLVLFAIIAALSWLSYSKQLDQFETSQAAEEAVYVREIRALLKQIDARLQQLASWLPALEGMSEALFMGDPDAMERLFERHWPSAQLDYDLQSVSFYSPAGNLIGSWDDGSVPPTVPLEWVSRVLRDERPVFAFRCAERCSQVGVLPLLVDDRTAGALVLTASVVELIIRFTEVTGREIGLLTHSSRSGNSVDDSERLLASWGTKVVAVSDARNQLPRLQHAAREHPQLPQMQGPVEFQDGERHFSIRLFPIRNFSAYGSGYFVVLSDISEAVQRIRDGAWHSVLVGIGGIVASELVLFMILSAPLTRLQRTSRVLPLLADHGFDEVRNRLKRHKRPWRVEDEIDNLDETAIDLAFQLEALNDKVSERTEALKLKMRDLDRERGFISSLLDTAQVIILTQDQDGGIGLANRYALNITGYELADLVGKPFRDLLNPRDAYKSADKLAKLARGESVHYSHEAELVCPTGRRLQLAWFHSSLGRGGEGGAVLLSAGLDITERKHAERRIAWLANHDPLTGLVNRRRFEDRLQGALRSRLDRGEDGALMYIDLDQFNLINDTLGHSAGDRVLESFAGNLARLGDTIAPAHRTLAARIGGDEFAVIVEKVDREAAVVAAERLREGLNHLEYKAGSEAFRITSSIGVALYPEHGLGLQELMQNADLAMYQAKSLGEGRVQLFSGDEAMRTRMAQRLRWKERIDEALANNRFKMYFQPILDLKSGQVTHYEALVRMQCADGDVRHPAEFIPVAEATGQIVAIDCRVLELVFATLKRLLESNGVRGMHINLSARTFQTQDWWSRLNQLLEDGDIDPEGLVFEITETAAVADLKDAGSLMELVRDKGCQFALDDFGVGFSSFNYIKELPVDLVKIDGAFITRLAVRPDSQLVVKAMVEVARGFGKRTVAEYVDSAATLEMLKQLNVDYAQGYHVGEPVLEEELVLG